MQIIIFNGKTYNSIDEMPANERQAYEGLANMFEDKNGNGIPDFLEGDMANKVLNAYTSSSSINLNGKMYNSMDELPPEMRDKIKGAFNMLKQYGMTSVISPLMAGKQTSNFAQAPTPSVTPRISQTPSAIQDDKSSNLMLGVGIGIGLMACLAALGAGLLFYLR